METGHHDPFETLKSSSEEYSVYDQHYEKIGKVDDILLDELDRVAYIGVKMGFFGTNSTLVPVEIVRVNDKRHLIEIAASAETIKHAPHFGHDDAVSPELEDRVRNYFGLAPLHAAPATTHPAADDTFDRFGPDPRVDTEPGERAEEQGPVLDGPLYREGEGRVDEPVADERAEEPLVEERLVEERPAPAANDRWDREQTDHGVTVHRRRR